MEKAKVNELLLAVIGQAQSLKIPVSSRIRTAVEINFRAKSRLGCCRRKAGEYIIELSAWVLEMEEQTVVQTLAHEVLHTCPWCADHGPQWKKWAELMNAKYGYHIARTSSVEEWRLPPGEPIRYLLVCKTCGAQIGRRRRSVLVEHPECYRCRCGGKLERQR